MKKALSLALLLAATRLQAAPTMVLSNGAPLVLEQDPRRNFETLVYQFETGAKEAGPSQQGALPLINLIIQQDTGSLSGRLLHLQASMKLSWDARGISAVLTAPPAAMPEALALMSQELRQPHLDDNHLGWGRAGVRTGIAGSFTDPGPALAWAARRAIYGQAPDQLNGQPAADEVGSLNADALNALLPVLFDPQRLSFGAAGPAGAEQVQAWIETDLKVWGAASRQDPHHRPVQAATPPRGVSVKIMDRKGQPEDYFMLVVPKDLPLDPLQREAALVALVILGQVPEGRLFKYLRAEHGWTYDVRAESSQAEWSISGHGDPAHITELLKALPGLVDGLSQDPPDAAALELARRSVDVNWRQYHGPSVNRLFDRLAWARWTGDEALAEKSYAVLPQVKAEDVQAYARSLTLVNAYLCLCGDRAHLHRVVKDLDWNIREEASLADPAATAAK